MTNAGHYPLVLGPTIAGMIVPKVLIDGIAGLNIIFVDTLKKIGMDFTSLLTPTYVPVDAGPMGYPARKREDLV